MENSLTGFSLREIFEMLADNKKTGVLTIVSEKVRIGRAWLRGGRLCRVETPEINSDEESGDTCREQIKESISDGLLEILAWNESVYRFKATPAAIEQDELSFDVKEVMADVAGRKAEWEKIKTEIPSLKGRVEIISRIDAELVNLTRMQWALISRIDKSDIVEDIQKKLNVSSLDVCRVLFDMSKKGLVRCFGEVRQVNSGVPAPIAGLEEKAVSKKQVRGGMVAVDEGGDIVPTEWASYYQLLDSRKAAVGDKVTGS